jgi:hypothetical protein
MQNKVGLQGMFLESWKQLVQQLPDSENHNGMIEACDKSTRTNFYGLPFSPWRG